VFSLLSFHCNKISSDFLSRPALYKVSRKKEGSAEGRLDGRKGTRKGIFESF
jgi:hypothetical protein